MTSDLGTTVLPHSPPELTPPPERAAAVPGSPTLLRPRLRERATRVLTSLPAGAALLFGLALALRLIELSRSYDIFIDEVTYTRIGMNVAHGAGVTLYGQPFNLHPPTVFALFAGVISAFGLHGSVEQTLFQLRTVTAVCGAIVPVAVFLLLNRAVSRRVALAAGLVLALDPFAILYDSRVMLEAPAQLGVAALFAFIAAAVYATSSRVRTWLIWAAGLCGAFAVTSKETFGMVVVVTLAALAVTGWVLERRQTLTILGVTVTGYCLAVLGASLSNGIGSWWEAKYDDVLRLIGVHQETGFNAPTTHVTLLSRVFANASQYATTYAILALGTIAAVGLIVRLRPWRNGNRIVRFGAGPDSDFPLDPGSRRLPGLRHPVRVDRGADVLHPPGPGGCFTGCVAGESRRPGLGSPPKGVAPGRCGPSRHHRHRGQRGVGERPHPARQRVPDDAGVGGGQRSRRIGHRRR